MVHYPPPPPGTGPGYPGGPPMQPPLAVLPGITITHDQVITPVGTAPRRECQITMNERTFVSQAIPTWAIVLAIVGFCILTIFSLLFLLVKETRVSGMVDVTVVGPGLTYTSSIPVNSQIELSNVRAQVGHAQGALTF